MKKVFGIFISYVVPFMLLLLLLHTGFLPAAGGALECAGLFVMLIGLFAFATWHFFKIPVWLPKTLIFIEGKPAVTYSAGMFLVGFSISAAGYFFK